MKGYVYDKDQTLLEQVDGAYFERNMLALELARVLNYFYKEEKPLSKDIPCGWYYAEGEAAYDGWKRIISIGWGSLTFHIPDDFDVGNLPQIKPNWDGHTTRQKWDKIAKWNGITLDW